MTFRKFAVTTLLAMAGVAIQAQVYNLAHNNSSAAVSVNSSAGMFNWTVEGQNQLNQQWFWFRVGANPEAPINTISAATVTQPDARTLYTSYHNGSFGVQIDYLLTGFSYGSGLSDIAESITITNATASPLNFHFFQYSDFNIGGPGGDLVSIGTNSNPFSPFFGRPNSASIIDPFAGMTETVLTPAANHAEAALVPLTITKLNNGVPDVLNDNLGPVGPGNVTWALQWDFIIAPMSSVGISKDKFIAIQPVPEPGMLALGALAAALMVRRRK